MKWAILLFIPLGCAFNLNRSMTMTRQHHEQHHAEDGDDSPGGDGTQTASAKEQAEEEAREHQREHPCNMGEDSILHLGAGLGLFGSALCLNFDITNMEWSSFVGAMKEAEDEATADK